MKQILLAIDGNDPSRPIFKYAADLCKHISARLCILQFINNRKGRTLGADYTADHTNYSNNIGGKIGNIEIEHRDMFGQDTKHLAGISGPLKKMLKNLNCPVPYSVALSAGSPENVLSGYVDSHHDIVLAVFDPSHDHAPAFARIKKLKERLGVPLVVVDPAVTKKAH
ncbi:hypothetical protein DO021_17225 [Desulfobacter hydrogenophilus]|uniref:Universal stress protein n=1 Tax=Desulfobacter hydrogenophilus TaxID=2291 RepID=A0A328FAT9_9BACT|nr:hypothetical protein [Desulfobacter hydrogenophilus]NDY74146.1 hypothetical protein [Desulfobacter hydrogenophilus]QBH15330.1 hypothetical protein EYB58_21910 [Desulfobacter hydrogenophilus]RAM00800.1 hypothetical protein DO021_17225 [Desulfobacter hydrogenophilus]